MPTPIKKFRSTKTYTHSVGLSCAFRQWRAESHCRFLHGYALQVYIEFEADNLDEKGWVVDFGSLKPVKAWLEETFDHKTLVARDDPQLMYFRQLHDNGALDLVEVPATGCERFAEMIWDRIYDWVAISKYAGRVHLKKVEVREHASNSGIVYTD